MTQKNMGNYETIKTNTNSTSAIFDRPDNVTPTRTSTPDVASGTVAVLTFFKATKFKD